MGYLPYEEDSKIPLDYGFILGCDLPDLISIFGSIGIIESWNSEKVMETLQEHIFSDYSHRKTGSLLGLALSGLKNFDENPAILALLSTNLQPNNSIHVIATLLGIQTMFSGTQMEELKELLQPLMFSESNEVVFFTAFTLGSIFSSSADEDLTSIMLQTFVEKSKEAETKFFRFLLLGLACLFYRRKDVECGLMEIGGSLSKHGSIFIKGFQYIGTGDSGVIESILTKSFTGETDALLESFAHPYPSNPQVSVLDLLEKSLNTGETNCVMSTFGSNWCRDIEFSYNQNSRSAIFLLLQGCKGPLCIEDFSGSCFIGKGITNHFSIVLR